MEVGIGREATAFQQGEGSVRNKPSVEMTGYSKGKQVALRSVLTNRNDMKIWGQKCPPARQRATLTQVCLVLNSSKCLSAGMRWMLVLWPPTIIKHIL